MSVFHCYSCDRASATETAHVGHRCQPVDVARVNRIRGTGKPSDVGVVWLQRPSGWREPFDGGEYDMLVDTHDRMGEPLNQIVSHVDVQVGWLDRIRILLGRLVMVTVRVAVDSWEVKVVASRGDFHVAPILPVRGRERGGFVLSSSGAAQGPEP